jgi:UDP-glucose 4-epimerase
MRIVVTGVAGFIGSNLAARLLKEGHSVEGIDNFSYGVKSNIAGIINHPNFKFVEGDILDDTHLKGIDGEVIVHLASQKIPRYSSAMATLADNGKMLDAVIKKCLTSKARLVFASTSDIYGKNPILPYTENSDSLLGPTTVKRWAYALSKIYGEQLIQAYHQDHALSYTIMRFFGSYGPHQNLTWWGGPQSVFIQNCLEKKPLEIHGDGKQTRTFTYVDDTVEGIYKCIVEAAAVNDIFNIAGNPESEITIHDLALLITRLVSGETTVPNIRFIPYETFGKYEDVMRRVPSIDKIKSKLGFVPRHSLEEGLRKTIIWQKNLSRS